MSSEEERRGEVREKLSSVKEKDAGLRKRNMVIAVVVAAILIVLAFAVWIYNDDEEEEITLTGAGATFPFPLVTKWTEVFENENGVKVSYEGVGSSGGISRIEDRLVDFAGSDAPLSTDKDDLGLVHIPETIGAVVCAYNVPGLDSGLNLTGDVIAGIFMLDIAQWDDPAIADINPGMALPDEDIVVVRRADGSGTTFIWSSYLTKINETWESEYGTAKTIDWPDGTIGGTGNGGVAGTITTTPYSLGYLELSYAIENEIDHAAIMNHDGHFVMATLETTAAAAGAASATLPDGDESWDGVDILDAPGEDSYPVASFTYFLVYKEQTDEKIGAALVEFLWWVIHDGQDYSGDLHYVPLPAEVVALNEATVMSMTFDGEPMYNG